MSYFANRGMREPARTASVPSGAHVFEEPIALSCRGTDCPAIPVKAAPARECDERRRSTGVRHGLLSDVGPAVSAAHRASPQPDQAGDARDHQSAAPYREPDLPAAPAEPGQEYAGHQADHGAQDNEVVRRAVRRERRILVDSVSHSIAARSGQVRWGGCSRTCGARESGRATGGPRCAMKCDVRHAPCCAMMVRGGDRRPPYAGLRMR